MGDGMAKTFKTNNCCGLVSDGGSRDLERINKVGFTVFGSGTVTNHAELIYRLAKEPIVISGVTFSNGTLLCGDRDGILAIPQECHAAWSRRAFWRGTSRLAAIVFSGHGQVAVRKAGIHCADVQAP